MTKLSWNDEAVATVTHFKWKATRALDGGFLLGTMKLIVHPLPTQLVRPPQLVVEATRAAVVMREPAELLVGHAEARGLIARGSRVEDHVIEVALPLSSLAVQQFEERTQGEALRLDVQLDFRGYIDGRYAGSMSQVFRSRLAKDDWSSALQLLTARPSTESAA
ncbi:MAG: hypothetical protein JJ863_38485 [Deltaproteobacteria bacterium]|nr:hypothetical protein [Deltaproteobacteria bacterium]